MFKKMVQTPSYESPKTQYSVNGIVSEFYEKSGELACYMYKTITADHSNSKNARLIQNK
jgi:hypothetical protein